MKIFASLIGYMPSILAAIIAVEQVIGKSAPGSTKKQLVMNSIAAAAKAGENVPEAHVSAISELVDTTVSTLKAAGVFGPATPTAA